MPLPCKDYHDKLPVTRMADLHTPPAINSYERNEKPPKHGFMTEMNEFILQHPFFRAMVKTPQHNCGEKGSPPLQLMSIDKKGCAPRNTEPSADNKTGVDSLGNTYSSSLHSCNAHFCDRYGFFLFLAFTPCATTCNNSCLPPVYPCDGNG